MERIKDIFSRPLVLLIVIILAIGSVVATFVLKGINDSKLEEISKYPITEIVEDENGKLIAKTINEEEAAEQDYEYVKKKYEEAVHPESQVVDTVTTYLNNRYNTPTLSVEDRLNKTLPMVADQSKDKVRGEMMKENITRFELLKVYHNGQSQDMLKGVSSRLSYVCNMKINGKESYYTVICDRVSEDGKEWKIFDTVLTADVN